MSSLPSCFSLDEKPSRNPDCSMTRLALTAFVVSSNWLCHFLTSCEQGKVVCAHPAPTFTFASSCQRAEDTLNSFQVSILKVTAEIELPALSLKKFRGSRHQRLEYRLLNPVAIFFPRQVSDVSPQPGKFIPFHANNAQIGLLHNAVDRQPVGLVQGDVQVQPARNPCLYNLALTSL